MVGTSGVDVTVLYVGDGDSPVAAGLSSVDGLTVTVLTGVSDVLDALDDADCIVSEYDLPTTTAPDLVARVHGQAPGYPFLAVVDDPADATTCVEADVTDCLTADLAAASPETLATRIESAVRTVGGADAAAMVEAIPDEIYTLDTDGVLTSVVPPADRDRSVAGYDPSALVGEPVSVVMDDDDLATGNELIRDLLTDEDRSRGSFEMNLVTKAGERTPFENHVALLGDDEFRGTVGVLRDISERKAREQEIRRLNERFEQFAATVPHGFFLIAPDYSELYYVNEAVADLYGVDIEDLRADPQQWTRHVVAEDLERLREDLDGDGEWASEPIEREFRVDHPERGVRWLNVTMHPIFEDGTVDRLAGVATDVTERRERVEKLDQLRENVTDVVWMTDPEKERMDFISDAYEDVWGRTPASLREDPQTFVEAIHPDDRERVEAALADQRTDPENYDETYRVVQPDGEVRWVHDRASGVYENGTLTRIVGVATDITERKERERELERAETVFRNAQDGVFLIDVADGEQFAVERVNPAYESMSGLDATEVEGRTPREIFGAEIGNRIEARFRECIQRRTTLSYEETFDLPGVPTHWYTQISPVVVDGEVEHIVGATRDITEQKERERQLELRETAMAEAPVGILIGERTRPGTPVVYANARFEELTGYDENAITGRNLSFITGEETDEGRLAELTTAVEQGETATVDLVCYRKDGTPFWSRTSVAPVVFENDEATHYVGFQRDITETKEYEQWIERRFDELSDVLAEQLGEPLDAARACLERARADGDEDAIADAERWLDRVDTLLGDLTTVHSFSVKPRDLSEAALGGRRDAE